MGIDSLVGKNFILPLTVVEGGRLGEQVAKDCTNGENYRVGVQYVEAVDR